MKSMFLKSFILSFSVTVSAYSSQPSCDLGPEHLQALAEVINNPYLDPDDQCSTCDEENCFSRRVDKSLGLGDKLTNLLLCPDFLVPVSLKRDVLEKVTPLDVNNNNNATDAAKTDEQVIAEFALQQDEARHLVGYDRLVALIFDPTRLNRAGQAAVLRKLGWVSNLGVSPAKIDVGVYGNNGGSFWVLPKPVLNIICCYLDNVSLGSMALVEQATMGVAQPLFELRLVSLRNYLVHHYHPSTGPAPFFNHLSYLTFAMKAFPYEEDEECDRVDWPLCLLNKEMKNYKDQSRVGLSGLIGVGLVPMLILKGMKVDETIINQRMALIGLFQQRAADWDLCRKMLKKQIGFNELNDPAVEDDSSEEECVIA